MTLGAFALTACMLNSCGSDDTPAGLAENEAVENFYMSFSVTGDAMTRTYGELDKPENPATEEGTQAENTISGGTLWLVDRNGKVAFSRTIASGDWDDTKTTKTTKPLKVSVNQVSENTSYQVFFMANYTALSLGESPVDKTLTATSIADISDKYANVTDKKFVMFNQNDGRTQGNGYLVEFKAENKDEAKPAKPTEAIKLDRVVARIDKVTSTTEIKSDDKKTDRVDATDISAISKLELQGYALKNVANTTNVMQQWNNSDLTMPNPVTFFNTQSSFGTSTESENLTEFKNEIKYIFENYQAKNDSANATSMYLQYKATVAKGANKDFEDGTFYLYDKHVFTSIQDVKTFAGAANPFGDKEASAVVAEISDNEGNLDETKLDAFRTAYNIEVFAKGLVYYRYIIKDTHNEDNGYGDHWAVLRNSIYRINVENIYDLGYDTPNGDDVKPNYYLEVTVEVNPWVLNTINIDLN